MKASRLVVFLLVAIVSSLAHADKLTGNTVGAAATNLSSLENAIENAFHPENSLGTKAARDKVTKSKAVCSSIGVAIGHAFAIQTEIRFYTQDFDETKNGFHKIIATDINELITALTDASNGFCANSSTNTAEATPSLLRAKQIALGLSEVAKFFEGK